MYETPNVREDRVPVRLWPPGSNGGYMLVMKILWHILVYFIMVREWVARKLGRR